MDISSSKKFMLHENERKDKLLQEKDEEIRRLKVEISDLKSGPKQPEKLSKSGSGSTFRSRLNKDEED